MLDDDDLYLDRVQLTARGWTRAMIVRFLPEPDRWTTVNHWQNYTGKAAFFVEKVMQAEALTDFAASFSTSVRRRGLTSAHIDAIHQERARVNTQYCEWIKAVTPEDVQRMLLIDDLVAAFEGARALGYRTPLE